MSASSAAARLEVSNLTPYFPVSSTPRSLRRSVQSTSCGSATSARSRPLMSASAMLPAPRNAIVLPSAMRG